MAILKLNDMAGQIASEAIKSGLTSEEVKVLSREAIESQTGEQIELSPTAFEKARNYAVKQIENKEREELLKEIINNLDPWLKDYPNVEWEVEPTLDRRKLCFKFYPFGKPVIPDMREL
jgi:hypothetical protein